MKTIIIPTVDTTYYYNNHNLCFNIRESYVISVHSILGCHMILAPAAKPHRLMSMIG